jgi:hypothetical protein
MTGYDGTIPAWGLLEKAAMAQTIFVGSNADYLRTRANTAKPSRTFHSARARSRSVRMILVPSCLPA